MKIIWSEKGLRVLRCIFTVIIAISALGLITAFFMIICGIGTFDYGYISKAEDRKTMIRIIAGVVIAAVCAAGAIFGNRINEAIDSELRRRNEIAQAKCAAKSAEIIAAQRANREEYRNLLSKYSDDNVSEDIRDGENQ